MLFKIIHLASVTILPNFTVMQPNKIIENLSRSIKKWIGICRHSIRNNCFAALLGLKAV